MFWYENLTQSERDELLENLNKKQKEFIKDYMKRGRKTIFANVLAKEKAGSDTEGFIAEKWELEDYLDAGADWQSNSELYCECGRRLRYQYIVNNLETGETKKFGINHFEEHTGIPPQLAKEIVRGIEKIDFEMDEVLLKISSDWSLADEGILEIPASLEIHKDIQLHFDNDVPLLNRQVKRLKEKIEDLHQEMKRLKIANLIKEKELAAKKKQTELNLHRQQVTNKRRQFKLDGTDVIPSECKLQMAVLNYLNGIEDSQISAINVCKELIRYYGASNEVYSSGKPRIYPDVCMFLEHLVQQGTLELVEKQGVEDRIYQILVITEKDDDAQGYIQETLFDI